MVKLPVFEEKAPAIGFLLGPNRLWIDEAPNYIQAEVWLELFTDDHCMALARLEAGGAIRCDQIEDLGDGFKGGWIMNPANVVHMVRTPDAW